jgi:hypothetical protein
LDRKPARIATPNRLIRPTPAILAGLVGACRPRNDSDADGKSLLGSVNHIRGELT